MAETLTYEYIRPPNRRATYHATVLRADHAVIIMRSPLSPSKPVVIDGAEVVGHGYEAVWFLFQGCPYDVARCYRPDGTFTGYYCDMLEPVRWNDADPHTLHPIVDLFLDLWVTPDSRAITLDQDEFDAAVTGGALTTEQAVLARRTLVKLRHAVMDGSSPPTLVRSFIA